jgi:release factor glutamine methyltransferase
MPEEDVFRPSEYTAALLRQLRLRASCTGRVLEMGTGSGVVLAALAARGASALTGVDVDPEAVRRAGALLQSQQVANASLHCGDLWEPLAGEVFDLVVFNPPQLPVHDDMPDGHRLRRWSDGGFEGREVLDRFLGGLGTHLAPDALCLITHSSFIEWDETSRLLSASALRAEVVQTVSVPLPAWKLRLLPPQWLEPRVGRSLHRVGPYMFCDFHVIEIRHAQAPVPP